MSFSLFGRDFASTDCGSTIIVFKFLLKIGVSFLMLGDDPEDKPADHEHRNTEEDHQEELQPVIPTCPDLRSPEKTRQVLDRVRRTLRELPGAQWHLDQVA